MEAQERFREAIDPKRLREGGLAFVQAPSWCGVKRESYSSLEASKRYEWAPGGGWQLRRVQGRQRWLLYNGLCQLVSAEE